MINKNDIKVIGLDLDDTLYPATSEIKTRVREKIYEKLASGLAVPVPLARELFETNYCGNFPWKGSGRRTIEEISRQQGVVINGSELVQQAIEEADILDLIRPNPGLVEFLATISQKQELDLITGSTYRSCFDKLERLGISSYLFKKILAEKKFGKKSDGSVYKYWLSLSSYHSGQHLYVGDNINQDIVVPNGLGIRTCFVGKESELADICIADISELRKHLLD